MLEVDYRVDVILCDFFIERERIIKWWKDNVSYLEDIGVVEDDSVYLK